MLELYNLPVEIIFNICNNLCITDVSALSETCKIFKSIISSRSFWQNRLLRRIGISCRFFADRHVDGLNFHASREHILNFFEPDLPDSIHLTHSHTSSFCIDAIHIIGSSGLFAVGDRSGVFSICSLSDILRNENQNFLFSDGHTHKGWIWSICSDANVIASCSWDSYLRIWTLDEATTNLSTSFKLNSAVLCSSFVGQNLVAAGTFDKSLVVHDYRAPPTQTALSNAYHRSAILCLTSLYSLPAASSHDSFASTDSGESTLDTLDSSLCSLDRSDSSHLPMNVSNGTLSVCASTAPSIVFPSGDNESSEDLFTGKSSGLFFTGSKDKLLAAWDIRSFDRPLAEKKFATYPRSISLLNADELWVAEQPNQLHVFTNTRKMSILASGDSTENSTSFSEICTQVLHGNWMGFGTIQANRNAIFLISSSGSVELLHPTFPPVPMCSKPLFTDCSSPPISLSYADETLLVGTGNGTVHLWVSKRHSEKCLMSSVLSC